MPAGVQPFCKQCGAPVLTHCGECGAEIAGQRIGSTSLQWKLPRFCLECSAPFPWLDRTGRMYLLQNLLDAETLDEATRLEVREELAALAAPEGR